MAAWQGVVADATARRVRVWCALTALFAGLVVATNAATASADATSGPHGFVAGVATPTGEGAWSVTANGTVRRFRAHDYGGANRRRLSQPITGMAATPSGNGYWLVAGDGGIFTYGDAHFYGSTGAMHLNRPIVGMIPTRNGHGYWLVGADGGIFTFGNAKFYGSLGNKHLDQPIVGITTTPSGRGYRMVARDGGIFTFGDAKFSGSLGGRGISDVVGMAGTPTGKGYWILRKFGTSCDPSLQGSCPTVNHFGDAANLGLFYCCPPPEGPPPNFDFAGDPAVALIANPVTQGYVMLRKQGDVAFSAGTPPGST